MLAQVIEPFRCKNYLGDIFEEKNLSPLPILDIVPNFLVFLVTPALRYDFGNVLERVRGGATISKKVYISICLPECVSNVADFVV